MARPKKVKKIDNLEIEGIALSEMQPVIEEKIQNAEESNEIDKFNIYNEHGLLRSVEYKFKSNGKIDWRNMISPEHVVLNKFNFALRGIDVDTLSEEAKNKLLQEAGEEDLVIKLAGFREIADIRSYYSIESELVYSNDNKVCIKVTINWKGNFENLGGYSVSAIASASRENTDDRFAKYLETIAENRAFVRAVRHSLGIVAVGQDEISQEDTQVQIRNSKVHSLLNDLMQKLNLDLDTLKILCAKEGFEWDDKWISVEKIDPATVITIIPILKQLANQ